MKPNFFLIYLMMGMSFLFLLGMWGEYRLDILPLMKSIEKTKHEVNHLKSSARVNEKREEVIGRNDIEAPWVMDKLIEASKKSYFNVEVWHSKEDRRMGLKVLLVEMEGKGTFEAWLYFLNELIHLPFPVKLGRFELTSIQDHVLKIHCFLTVFFISNEKFSFSHFTLAEDPFFLKSSAMPYLLTTSEG